MNTRNQVILGTVVTVAGLAAAAWGQSSLWSEMDAADVAGSAGTLFGFGGVTLLTGALLIVAGIALLAVGGVKATRRKTASA